MGKLSEMHERRKVLQCCKNNKHSHFCGCGYGNVMSAFSIIQLLDRSSANCDCRRELRSAANTTNTCRTLPGTDQY